jgi:hypothetical protein
MWKKPGFWASIINPTKTPMNGRETKMTAAKILETLVTVVNSLWSLDVVLLI